MIKKLIFTLICVLSSGFVQAADWKYLGTGMSGSGKFAFFIDQETIETKNSLRGVRIKYEFVNSFVVVNYSISCKKESFVTVTSAKYDANGNVIGYNGEFSSQAFIGHGSTIDSIKNYVCADYYQEKESKSFVPFNPNIPRP